jgi:hypothetical protein
MMSTTTRTGSAVRRAALTLLVLSVYAMATGCAENARDVAQDTTAAAAGSSAPARVPNAPDTQTVTLQMGNPIRKYGVRSGVVEYVNARLGRRQTLYFDNGGADEAVYLAAGDDSVDVPFDVSIYTGTWRFDYNSRTRTGIAKQQPNAPGAMLGLLPDLREVPITPIESRTIAGQRASGISYGEPPARAWMYKGIPLRIERPVRGGADTLVIEAVSITLDEKIPAGRFQVPDEVKIARLK